MGKRPSFTNINDNVCMYCSRIVFYSGRDDNNYGCKLRKAGSVYKGIKGEEKWIDDLTVPVYRSIDNYESHGDELTVKQKGCEEFESSGMPAHPIVIKELKRRNYLAENIPVDKNATETSWDFDTKMRKYIGEENVLLFREQIESQPDAPSD